MSGMLHSLEALRILRERAAGICRTAGVLLPPRLLAEGLPGPGGALASPMEGAPPAPATVRAARTLDPLIEWWIATHPDRKGAGLFLTPPGAAHALLAQAAHGGWRPSSVVDPAVGGGVFLVAAHALWGREVALFGLDIDPMAVASTRLALWIAGIVRDPEILIGRVRVGDALAGPDPWKCGPPGIGRPAGGFDLVCGNPPFGNAIEKRTALSGERRRALARRYPDVARGPCDRSVLFLRVAGDLVADRGRIAFLLPRAVLAARYARGLRGWASHEMPLTGLVRYPDDAPCHEASITMVGWIAAKGPPPPTIRVLDGGHREDPARGTTSAADGALGMSRSRRKGGRAPLVAVDAACEVNPGGREVPHPLLRQDTWGALLDPIAERIEAVARAHPLLGATYLVRSGATVGEAYGFARDVREGGGGWRLLTSGAIARYGDRWEDRPARYLGREFLRPTLPREGRGVGAARGDLYDAPKIVVCGLSRVMRACADPRGECAGSVGTYLVLPRGETGGGAGRMRRLLILLNSAWYSMIHRSRRGAAALSGGNIPLGRRDLEEMPLPEVFLRTETDGVAQPWNRNRVDHPSDPDRRLSILDHADVVRDDRSLQRAVLDLAGYGEEDARAILDAWCALMEPRRRGRPGRSPTT